MRNDYLDGYNSPDRSHGSSEAQQGARQRAADDRFNKFYKEGGGFPEIGRHTGPAHVDLSNRSSGSDYDLGAAVGGAIAGTSIGGLIAGLASCAFAAGLFYVAWTFANNRDLLWVAPVSGLIALWLMYQGTKLVIGGLIGTVKFIFSVGGILTALICFVGYGVFLSSSRDQAVHAYPNALAPDNHTLAGSNAPPAQEPDASVPLNGATVSKGQQVMTPVKPAGHRKKHAIEVQTAMRRDCSTFAGSSFCE